MKDFKKFEKKIEEKIDINLLLFKIFDEPRPKYIAKVTIIDKIIDTLLLWAFPEKVRPNYITAFRFLSIPFIVYLVLSENYVAATVLFGISAFSDAVDGAMARTRNQITDWGILFDPFTDKLLVSIVGGILIFKFISPTLALTIIFLEIFLMTFAYFRFKGEVIPAKTSGKIKMVFQCFGVGFLFLFLTTAYAPFLIIATWLLYLSVISALLSLLIYKSI